MLANSFVPWRERAFVSVTEAAQIVARSTDWIRGAVNEERLKGARLTVGGPLVIAVPSLTRLIDEALPVDALGVKPLNHRPRRRELRLVVSNG